MKDIITKFNHSPYILNTKFKLNVIKTFATYDVARGYARFFHDIYGEQYKFRLDLGMEREFKIWAVCHDNTFGKRISPIAITSCHCNTLPIVSRWSSPL